MTEYDDLMVNASLRDDEDSDDYDTDEELKEAFAAGLIKPGLNLMGEGAEKKVPKNNVAAMKQKLEELQRSLPWVSNLDLEMNLIVLVFAHLTLLNHIAYCSDRDIRSGEQARPLGPRVGDEGGSARQGEAETVENRQGNLSSGNSDKEEYTLLRSSSSSIGGT